MPDRDKPIDQQLWANLGFIRSHQDRQYAIDVLEARRDFLRLSQRQEREIRQVYIRAAQQVAKDLRNLKPTVGQLTRNHLAALEKALRREVDAINQSLARITREGIEESVKLGARPIDNQLLRALTGAEAPLDFIRLQRGFAEVNRAAVEALWVRTRHGLRVSERVWRAAQRARDSMRNILTAGIAAGRDTVQIARDLEEYVRKGVGTLAKDYPAMMARMGKRIPRNLSYEALRLVRTEKAKAYTEGTYSRGRVNPSYKGAKWMLSDSHVIVDICDDFATRDLYGMGPGVYPKGHEPVIPHPNCLCYTIAVLTETEKFVEDLIAWKNNSSSQPYLEQWYNEVYRPMVGGSPSPPGPPAVPRDPIRLIPGVSLGATRAIRLAGEELRMLTVSEGVEFAAMVDIQSGAELGSRIRGARDGVNIADHLKAMVDGRRYVQIHTHPMSSSFSPQDAALLAEQDPLAAVFVVGQDETRYLLSKATGARLPTRREIHRAYQLEMVRLQEKYVSLIRAGELDDSSAWKEHSHEIWTQIAERLGFSYERWVEHGI